MEIPAAISPPASTLSRLTRSFVPPSLRRCRLDPALGHRVGTPTYPLTLELRERTNASKVMSVLRDHYEGTPFDLTKGPAAGPWGTPNRWGGGANAIEARAVPRPASLDCPGLRCLFAFAR